MIEPYIQENVELYHNGEKVRRTVLIFGRRGSKAPQSYYILDNGRKISPYEQRLRGWSFGLNGLFKLVYSRAIAELIPSSNGFLKIIKRESKGVPYVKPR